MKEILHQCIRIDIRHGRSRLRYVFCQLLLTIKPELAKLVYIALKAEAHQITEAIGTECRSVYAMWRFP